MSSFITHFFAPTFQYSSTVSPRSVEAPTRTCTRTPRSKWANPSLCYCCRRSPSRGVVWCRMRRVSQGWCHHRFRIACHPPNGRRSPPPRRLWFTVSSRGPRQRRRKFRREAFTATTLSRTTANATREVRESLIAASSTFLRLRWNMSSPGVLEKICYRTLDYRKSHLQHRSLC